jgi:hypothetical protein
MSAEQKSRLSELKAWWSALPLVERVFGIYSLFFVLWGAVAAVNDLRGLGVPSWVFPATVFVLLLPLVVYLRRSRVDRIAYWLEDPAKRLSHSTPERMGELAEQTIAAFVSAQDTAFDTSSLQLGSLAWTHGAMPIADVALSADHVWRNFHYRIELKPRTKEIHTATATLRVDRPLPEDEEWWVSVARTKQALDEEYLDRRCLLRELAPVETGLWEESLDWIKASLETGEAGLTWGALSEQEDKPELVRYRFPRRSAEGEGPLTRLQVTATYPWPASTRAFPVVMPNYFCAGDTIEVSIEIPEGNVLNRPYVMWSHGRRVGSQYDPREWEPSFEAPNKVTVYNKEPGPLLVWPGSGIVFTWSAATAGR